MLGAIITALKEIIDLLRRRDESRKIRLESEAARLDLAERTSLVQKATFEDLSRYDPKTREILRSAEDAERTQTRARFGLPFTTGVLLLTIAASSILFYMMRQARLSPNESEPLVSEIAYGRADITIVDPPTGGVVAGDILVRGMAKLPPGDHLWVFVQVYGLAGWWPQAEASVNPQNGEWAARAVIGMAGSDVRTLLRIAAVAVDEREHQRLTQYVSVAMRTRNWAPIGLRGPSPPTTVTVTRQ